MTGKPYFVLLTGSINNAGDFLIKYRAKELFGKLRTDRGIVDFDRWKPLTDEQLQIINNSNALILTGGPSIQPRLYPSIFPLRKNLNDIKVPVLTMGAGWNHSRGSWADTHNYGFSESSLSLLRKIEESAPLSSVRDYHTLNTLHSNKFRNFLMTGCPALYDPDKIGIAPAPGTKINEVTFSLGARFLHSRTMSLNVQEVIKALRHRFGIEKLIVVFHHSINPENYSNKNVPIFKGQIKMVEWLKSQRIRYKDISGSAENLITHYNQTDLHIGYRVHAHIFCSSITKPSLLIAEDGRGFGLKNLNIGAIYPGFRKFRLGGTPITKALYRLMGKYVTDPDLPRDLISVIDYELENSWPRLLQARHAIDNLFPTMKKFLHQLP